MQSEVEKLVEWLLTTAANSDNPEHFAPRLREAASLIERLYREREELRNHVDDLQQAEAEYRLMHDRHGDASGAAGRAWDLLKKAGDRARSALAEQPQ